MNKLGISMAALASGLACAGALAQVLARGEYQARDEAITLHLRSAEAACAPLAGQPAAVCLAEASAEERIARSELGAQYRPSARARHHALVVAADSRLALARVHCDNLAGIARSNCITQAIVLRTSAHADALAQRRTFEANARAAEQSAEDREEAASDTFAARYAAARLQCDGYVDKLRERCLLQTRDQYLKP